MAGRLAGLRTGLAAFVGSGRGQMSECTRCFTKQAAYLCLEGRFWDWSPALSDDGVDGTTDGGTGGVWGALLE